MKSTVLSGMVTGARKARWNPLRETAASQHAAVGWSQAPRPGALASGSGTTAPSTVAKRCRRSLGARAPQPAHRRMGFPPTRPPPGLRRPDDVGVLVLERLVAVEAAVAGVGQRGVRAAAAVAQDRG